MLIAGVDEAGRGPLAGPVVAAAVVFEDNFSHPEIKDSKQLSAKIREKLARQIKHQALAWAVVAVGHKRIERLNILQASRLAMALAVEHVAQKVSVQLVRVDGNTPIETALPQEVIVGGDRTHVHISAASILAKVWRDGLMKRLDRKYPGYGFAKHKGYPTSKHRQAIAQRGPCPVHRLSFRGVKEFLHVKDFKIVSRRSERLPFESNPQAPSSPLSETRQRWREISR